MELIKMKRRRSHRIYSLIFAVFIGTVVLVGCRWRESNRQISLTSAPQANCIALSVEEIRAHYSDNDVTSGRMNPSDFLVECQSKPTSFGFYDLIDRRSGLKPPVVAKVLVSFDKVPWNYSNSDQNIVAIVAMDKLLKFNPLPVQLGDSVEKVKKFFTNETVIGDIHYFSGDNCAIAVKLKDGIILKYIIVYCKAENFSLSNHYKDIGGYLD